MPNYVRWRERGATYFFTVVTDQRRKILCTRSSRQFLRSAFREVRGKWPFALQACVLLPDHLHCIWTLPDESDDFAIRWSRIKRRFTERFLATGGSETSISESRRRESRRGVWQPRYWEHRIRDETDFDRHRDYIHLNPVSHGYVDNPGDWKWSSFHRHVRLGRLDPDWPGTSPVELPVVPE